MARKTHYATLAAIAAGLSLTLVSTELSGAAANAEDAGTPAEAQAPLTGEVLPVFIAEEVVQPLPAPPLPEAAASTTQSTPAARSLAELVSGIDTSSPLSREMQCLAGAVYFEARGEPLAGQLAVAQVVINRTQSDIFPESYCGVVYQPAQFSFVRNGRMPRVRESSPAWQRAKAIARIAHEDLWDSEAGDALYFHARYVSPRWSRTKSARATINTHIFYR